MTVQAIAKIIRETVDADMSQRLHKVDEAATAILALLSAPQDREAGAPVAWRVFDGVEYFIFHDEEAASAHSLEHGSLIQPLYLSTPPQERDAQEEMMDAYQYGNVPVEAMGKPTPPSVAGIPDGLINELDNIAVGLGGALSKVHCERFNRRHPDFCGCESGCYELRDTLRKRLSASPSPALDGAEETPLINNNADIIAQVEAQRTDAARIAIKDEAERAKQLGVQIGSDAWVRAEYERLSKLELSRIAIKDEAKEEAAKLFDALQDNALAQAKDNPSPTAKQQWLDRAAHYEILAAQIRSMIGQP